MCVFCFAARAVIVLFLFRGLVQGLDFFSEVKNAKFDSIDGSVEVYIVVVSVDRTRGALLDFLALLAVAKSAIKLHKLLGKG